MARKKKRSYGEVRHSKWYKGKPNRWRRISSNVEVSRTGDTGEARVKPYRAIVCLGQSGSTDGPRLPAHRCGEGRGRTPTRAIKAALQDVGRSFK